MWGGVECVCVCVCVLGDVSRPRWPGRKGWFRLSSARFHDGVGDVSGYTSLPLLSVQVFH